MHQSLQNDQASHSCHAHSIPPDYSIGDLFRAHGEEYIHLFKPDIQKIKLIRAIRICKTPALGGRVIKCKECGEKVYIYHSCGHSQCPLCQSIKRALWQDKVQNKLLKVPYVHTVFTLPEELRHLAKTNKKEIYNLLIRSSWKTIKLLSADPDNLGALPGMISVLHSFGSDMKFHPHVHCLITFGGIDKLGKWQWPKRKKKLIAFRVFRRTFRDFFLEELEKLFSMESINTPKNWKQIYKSIKRKQWNVRSSYPSLDTEVITQYLARYINRVAISKNRLSYSKEQQEVQIIYNDYKNQQKNKAAPKETKILDPLLAIDQLLVHVLPPYFQKARYYGLHASCTYKKTKMQIPHLMKTNNQSIRTVFQILTQLLKLPPYKCENCQSDNYTVEKVKPDKSWIHCFIPITLVRPPPVEFKHITYAS